MKLSIKLVAKTGVFTDDGKTQVVPAQFDKIFIDNGFIIGINGNKKGIYTGYGDKLSDVIYDDIKVYPNDIIQVKDKNKWGILSASGSKIIDTIYKKIKIVNDNAFVITDLNGLEGVIDLQGKMIVEPKYKKIKIADNLIFATDTKNKIGVIDFTTGNKIIENAYKECKYEKERIVVKDFKNNVGVYNLNGELLVPCMYYKCLIYTDCIIVVSHSKLNGLLNRNGELVVPVKCAGLYHMDNDPYAIMSVSGLYGVVDLDGKQLLDCKYANVELTDSADAFVLTNITGFKGIADMSGKIIIEPAYQKIRKYENFYILKEDNKYGIADATGKIMEPTVFDDIRVNEKLKLIVAAKDGLKGAFNYLFDAVIPMKYNKIEAVENYIKVAIKKNGSYLYGLYDSKFKIKELLKHKNIFVSNGKISFQKEENIKNEKNGNAVSAEESKIKEA